MELHRLVEPVLQFGLDTHVCPRAGITDHEVYDSQFSLRRERINIGAVGTSESLESLNKWLTRCSAFIPPKVSKQPELFPPFPGFSREYGFKAEFVFNELLAKQISRKEVEKIASMERLSECIEAAIELYYPYIEFLAQNRNPDVILCVLPQALYTKIYRPEFGPVEENLNDESENKEITQELNFRRAIKAKSMFLRIPLQLVWEENLQESPSGKQDDATRAWNFCTALYYKASQSTPATIPWRLPADVNRPPTCFIGIGFYRSRDQRVLNTSLAQVFDELGKSVILRGTEVEKREDRRPHLTDEQAFNLLIRALKAYKVAIGNLPARLVLHKSSNFDLEEIEGFSQAASQESIQSVDFVTIRDSNYRLFRKGNYPPYRGTWIELDSENHLLYTRGSVLYYQTYPGMYIPQPLEIRIVESESSPRQLLREILELTKMNWNNTQFDGKYPITIKCARKVGDIMKYLSKEDNPEIGYRFYM